MTAPLTETAAAVESPVASASFRVRYSHPSSRIQQPTSIPISTADILDRLRLPISSSIVDRIFHASTGLVGSIEFSSIRQIKQGHWSGPEHGAVSASQSRFPRVRFFSLDSSAGADFDSDQYQRQPTLIHQILARHRLQIDYDQV
ncbi:hypothetical protein PGTUg99_030661 [Puccinia graminis f. sp. tritici]|uniref:Uncharacterized protein n=1 Tax=Puccinia graminis f. sp. tritici TaxID=56615 RepID=A0A5B0RGS4_PUCGR|nr:hypothetical protein PGTUg99_030661 [Puccinia graminis f. sp. tritici]